MNKERKIAILNHLYPTSEIAKFMMYDLYIELLNIIPKNLCFSGKNDNIKVRKENKALAKEMVVEFLNANINYKNRLFELFPNIDLEALVDNILIGYILYLTPHINNNTGADVFQDRRSIYYTKYSVFDII